MRLSDEQIEYLRDVRYNDHSRHFKDTYYCEDITNLFDTIKALQAENEQLKDENASIRNWNACEEADHKKLLESDRKRIELEEEVERLNDKNQQYISEIQSLCAEKTEQEDYRAGLEAIIDKFQVQTAAIRGALFELNEIAKDYAPWGNRYNGKGIGDIIQNADKLLNTVQDHHNPADVDKCYTCKISMQGEELGLLLKEKDETLRKAREALELILKKHTDISNHDKYPKTTTICHGALAEIDKVIGGGEK
ncbi:MAG: hypothetical protein ACM3TR_09970 [Caulobacteraceae bacterium]